MEQRGEADPAPARGSLPSVPALALFLPREIAAHGNGAVDDLLRPNALLQHLARGGDRALAKEVLPANGERVESEAGGDPLHLHLGGEKRLRSSKPPEGAVRRGVG